MTYGQVKLRLTQMFPGISLDLIEGWINDRYAEILGEIPWQRQNVTGVLQTLAPYTAGTVTLSNGSNAVTGAGTTFTTAMTGRAFRVTGRSEIYEFTQTGATAATLDRPYEGPDGAALAYTIFQHVYLMPADCRILQAEAFANFQYGPLLRLDRSELNTSDPSRNQAGVPRAWASYMDDSSTPPRLQVELYPVPDAVYSIPFTYGADAGALSGTTTVLQVWLQPTALIEGVVSKAKRHLKDYAGAQLAAVDAKNALLNMRTSEAQGMPNARLTLGSYYTRHRLRRVR